jgi:hypothetical protein
MAEADLEPGDILVTTRLIRNGQRIRLNGTAGYVEILH